jgi:hypothetical protein
MCASSRVETLLRNESEPCDICSKGRISELSIYVGTRKMVNYAWERRSQGKLWWRLVEILTCKSFF